MPTKKQLAEELSQTQEAFANAQRAIEDLAYVNLTDYPSTQAGTIKSTDIVAVRKAARAFAESNPMAKHANNLMSWFTFGQGLACPKVKGDTKSTVPDELVTQSQQIVQDFWNDRDNVAVLTDYYSQDRLIRKLLNAGDLFLALIVDEVDGTTKVRCIDPNEVVDVVTAPGDANKPLYYVRVTYGKQWDFKAGRAVGRFEKTTDYYRDYEYDEWASDNEGDSFAGQATKEPYVYHRSINAETNEKFGIPEVYAAMDWIRVQRDMTRDMATLISALASLAWKKKVRGTASNIAQQANAMRPQANGGLDNPPAQAGSVVLENQDVNWQSMKADTGGVANAVQGIRQLGLVIAVNYGLSEHYFANGANANLASATAMELPVLKKFEASQQWWECVFIDVLTFVLQQAQKAGTLKCTEDELESLIIDCDFPPIVHKDIAVLINALAQAVFGKFITPEQAANIALVAFGFNNVDVEIEALKTWEAENPNVPAMPKPPDVAANGAGQSSLVDKSPPAG